MPTIQKEIAYPDTDGKPVAETEVHVDILLDARSRLKAWAAARGSAYAAGNMFVYYEEGNPKARLAPDGFVAFGVADYLRRSFKTWVEGVFPRVVFEFTSRGTRRDDLGKKLEIYRDVWAVAEYFLFDPLEEYLDPSLRGYRLAKGEYKPIPVANGRLTSAELGITIERRDRYLLMRDAKTGQPLELPTEKRAARAEREAAKVRASLEQSEAGKEQAEAEVARLKAELAALRKKKPG